MDYKELMCGDWVKVDQTTETVKARVLGVYKDGINYEVDYSGVRATNQIHTDYVSPIKLTDEILMNNGWRKEPITIDGDYANWHGEIPICQEDDEFNYERIELTYVHQLQHLLRLAGVQKEIEL
jgi:hypothetical protein